MSNRSKTLYTGVSSNLHARVFDYKTNHYKRSFAAKYKLDRLVYYEEFQYITSAIHREKQVKGWTRIKKIALIVSMNPAWKDLSDGWFDPPDKKCMDPSPAKLRQAQDDNSKSC